jgi:hypothetical protein
MPPRTFETSQYLGYKNLIVGGCSFTYNHNQQHVHTWPYYLRDLGGFENIYDTSCPGVGNNHIHRSIVTLIDTTNIVPIDTLVVVMWSGYDRDDYLVDPRAVVAGHPNQYSYTDNVSLGITGGELGDPNVVVNLDNIKKIKNYHSRALENYIAIQSLYSYLTCYGFKCVFTEFSDPGTMRDSNFDPVPVLPSNMSEKFVKLTRQITPTLGKWALPTLDGDVYHPNPNHQLSWTKEVLLPYLVSL